MYVNATGLIVDLQHADRIRPGPLPPTFFFLVTMGLGFLAALQQLLAGAAVKAGTR